MKVNDSGVNSVWMTTTFKMVNFCHFRTPDLHRFHSFKSVTHFSSFLVVNVERLSSNKFSLHTLAPEFKIHLRIYGPSDVVDLHSRSVTITDRENVWQYIRPNQRMMIYPEIKLPNVFYETFTGYITNVNNELQYIVFNKEKSITINGRFHWRA